MELAEGIKARRAVRHYLKKAVEKELLEKVFELARWSPVADVFKSWSYIVVTGQQRDKVASLISKNTSFLRDLLLHLDEVSQKKALDFYPNLGNAPVIILQTIPLIEDHWQRKILILCAGTEMQNLLLAAHNQGLGSCGVTIAPWVEEKIMEELGVKDREILAGITIGYADEKVKVLPHKKAEAKYI